MRQLMKLITAAAIVSAISCSSTDMRSASLSSVLSPSSNVSGTEPVKLITGINYSIHTIAGDSKTLEYKVKVKNIAFEKKVWIHQKKKDGTWVDLPAVYQSPADPGYEIWKADFQSYYKVVMDNHDLSDEFVVKYTVNGVTYWDNNNGLNYRLADKSGVMLGNGVNVLSDSAGFRSNGDFAGTVNLKNIGYNKKVKIIYSTDKWKTVKTADLTYNSSYVYGVYYSGKGSFTATIPSPNPNNVESWGFVVEGISNTVETIDYCFAYEVNGAAYWDNNFGSNYKNTRSLN